MNIRLIDRSLRRLLLAGGVVVSLAFVASSAVAQTAQQPPQPRTAPPPSYTLPKPAGWSVERFALPPDFAPSFGWKGTEDIRFHPDWADSTSEGYWSYTYLWWIDGALSVDATSLQRNIQAYYTGLVGRNIAPRKIPAEKLIATVATIEKVKALTGDQETFSGTVRMLDYMAQRPMILNCLVHVRDARTTDKSAVLIEVSPQPVDQAVWKKLDSIPGGFMP